MKATKKISEKLNNYMLRKDDLKIAGWLFNFQEGKAVNFGLNNNKIGGPYTPPSTNDIYGGAAYIKWADNRISEAVINTSALEDLDAALGTWRLISYYDADAPDILEPLPMPQDLKIRDDKVVDLITKNSTYFFEILKFYNEELGKKDYTRTVKGEIKAEHLYVTLMNSKGLNLVWEETDVLTGAVVNDSYEDQYHRRKMPEKEDLKKIVKEIDEYMVHTRTILPVEQKKMSIVITPGILRFFLGMYIVSNIRGEIVANNQSPFSVKDFEIKKQVFDEQINLIIDGLEDYSPTTQPCSGEGVPSTKQYAIANGRLLTPLVDLKYAKKIGVPPTSTGGMYFDIQKMMPYGKMVTGIDYGLVLYGVLGLHTQDSKRGDYSLGVDQGLVIKNGGIAGKIKKATIKGNFFDDLKNKKTKFAMYREDEIAMRTEASITV